MFACAITGLMPNGDEMKTNFIYDEAQPFEIRLQNVTGGDMVFSRDLLAESYASAYQVGLGHVVLTVNSIYFFLAVQTGAGYKGWVKICYPRAEVQDFLTQTYDLVPFGNESMDIDALLDDFYNDKI